jgi:hypothetical protein
MTGQGRDRVAWALDNRECNKLNQWNKLCMGALHQVENKIERLIRKLKTSKSIRTKVWVDED